jgi:HTH-type transcriptional regulator / antitoxin HigA
MPPSAFPLRNDADYQRALALLDDLWDAEPGSPEADVLDIMATLIEVYEKGLRTLPPADPRQVIAFKLRDIGWTQRELGRRLGWGSGRVSEVVSGRRSLTLRMVQELSAVLGLPPGLLVHDLRAEDSGAVRREDGPGTGPSYTSSSAAAFVVRETPAQAGTQVFRFPSRAAA